jgi:hypothetical protein
VAENDNQTPEQSERTELDEQLQKAVDRAGGPDKRKSISVRGTTYARLKEHCDASGETMSGLVERLINAFLDASR